MRWINNKKSINLVLRNLHIILHPHSSSLPKNAGLTLTNVLPFLINIQGSSCFLRPRPDSPEAPEGPGTSSRSVPSSKMCAFQKVYLATMFTLTFNSVIFHHIHIHIYPQFSTLTFSKSYPTNLLSLSNNQPLHFMSSQIHFHFLQPYSSPVSTFSHFTPQCLSTFSVQ